MEATAHQPLMHSQVQPIMSQPQPGLPADYATFANYQQPAVKPGIIKQQRAWSSGLFDCFEDTRSCLLVWHCRICYQWHLARRMGECFCAPIAMLRTKFRTEHGIEGTICSDYITVVCCNPCATCQLARELDFIERNPSM